MKTRWEFQVSWIGISPMTENVRGDPSRCQGRIRSHIPRLKGGASGNSRVHLINRAAETLLKKVGIDVSRLASLDSCCPTTPLTITLVLEVRRCHRIPPLEQREPTTVPGLLSSPEVSENLRPHFWESDGPCWIRQQCTQPPVGVEIPGLARDGEWLAAGQTPTSRLEQVEQAQRVVLLQMIASCDRPRDSLLDVFRLLPFVDHRFSCSLALCHGHRHGDLSQGKSALETLEPSSHAHEHLAMDVIRYQ